METGNNVWWERAACALCGKTKELGFARFIWAARRGDLRAFIDTLLSVRKYYVTSNIKLICYLST